MANRFLDSAQHYTTAAQMRSKYNSVTTGVSIDSTGSDRGGPAISVDQNNHAFAITLDNQATWIIGFRYWVSGLGFGATGMANVFQFRDIGFSQVDWGTFADGTVGFKNNSGTLLVRSSLSLHLNKFYYIELKVTLNSSTGAVEVRVNEQVYATATGLNTGQSGNNYANNLQWIGGGNNGDKFSDLYCNDTSGAINNSYIGDADVDAVFPRANGSTNQWTSSSGNPNWQNVDEHSPNDDTDYNSSNTVNDVDDYLLDTISNQPLAYQLVHRMKKTDAGTRSFKSIIQTSGSPATSYVGSLEFFPSASDYLYFLDPRDVNPNTSARFTVSDFNAYSFGVKLIS